mgnify:CR=1 FL=1
MVVESRHGVIVSVAWISGVLEIFRGRGRGNKEIIVVGIFCFRIVVVEVSIPN